MYQKTSLLAYTSILGNLGNRQCQVLQELRNGPMSNLDISRSLSLPINQITPRTNELVQAGLVHEEFKAHHEITGRQVIYWGLTRRGQSLFSKKNFVPFGQLMML